MTFSAKEDFSHLLVEGEEGYCCLGSEGACHFCFLGDLLKLVVDLVGLDLCMGKVEVFFHWLVVPQLEPTWAVRGKRGDLASQNLYHINIDDLGMVVQEGSSNCWQFCDPT